jgi:GTP-binding protein
LISVISAARPKIADYPFTTLTPNLGIVRIGMGKSFTVADIPGIIEGAHAGKGLGIQFLRHIERTRMLAFLIESTSDDPKQDFKTLVNELRSYNPGLLEKPSLVVLTKIDIVGTRLKKLGRISFGKGITVFPISAATRTGISELLQAMWNMLEEKA